MQTYMDATILPSDTIEQKMGKLYLSVCSVGEQLYSAGSAVSEFNKKINQLETTIANFRRDLATLHEEIELEGVK